MRTIAAMVCLLAMMIAQQAVAQQPCPTLVVDSTGDAGNGDISSPCALIANPGSNGITLREALFAANNAAGPGTITITFAPSLAGRTISTTGGLGNPNVSRNDIAIIGPVDGNGQPTVTIDASPMGSGILMLVDASNFTLASLRFTGLQPPNGGKAQGVAIVAGALWTGGPYYSPGNQQVSGITIRGNVFANISNPLPNAGNYISLVMQNGSSGALLSNVTITGNTFKNFQGNSNGLLVGSAGSNNVIQNVVIEGNSFSNIAFPVEFTNGDAGNQILHTRVVGNSCDAGNQILHTRVVGNSFVGNILVVTFTAGGSNGQPATGNLIDDTLVAGNQFLNNRGPDVGLTGGMIYPGGGSTNVSGNTVSNTQIVNNLMAGNYQYGGISIGGGGGGASNNTVRGVTITNNTIVNYSGSNGDGGAINVTDTNDGSPGNTVSGVTALNTILWNNTPYDFYGLVTPSQVTTSITAQAGYAGVNGTISANPQFVNPASDFELQSGSPARGAGTRAGAPAIDLDCQLRGSPPSIGAYEFDGPNVCRNALVPSPLLAAVLPESRSAQPGGTITAFATMINSGSNAASGCSIYPVTNLPGTFVYQTTNPATNALTGTANAPVGIAGNNGSQSFVIAVTPSAAIAPSDVAFNFGCAGVPPAPSVAGLNTLLLSASTTSPTPDIIALGATLKNDGIVHVTGSPMQGVFAVATDNLGSADSITVGTNTGGATLPLTITVCQSNPQTGVCLGTPAATVTTSIASNATPTFVVNVSASAAVPFDPANNRIFVTFTDSTKAVRGETSVAVETN
jgi:hypothetical protein